MASPSSAAQSTSQARPDLREALRRSEEGRARLRSALAQARAEADAELRATRKQLRAAEELLAGAERFDVDEGASAERIEALRTQLESLARTHVQLGESELGETRTALSQATATLAAEQETGRKLRAEISQARAAAVAVGSSRAAAASNKQAATMGSSFFFSAEDSSRVQLSHTQQSLQSAMVELATLRAHNAELQTEVDTAGVNGNAEAVAAAGGAAREDAYTSSAEGPSGTEALRSVCVGLEALAAQRSQLLRGWADAAWQLRRVGHVEESKRSALAESKRSVGAADPAAAAGGTIGISASEDATGDVASARQAAAESALRQVN